MASYSCLVETLQWKVELRYAMVMSGMECVPMVIIIVIQIQFAKLWATLKVLQYNILYSSCSIHCYVFR